MADVVDLAEKVLERGQASFALCPRCEDQSAFVPIVLKNRQGTFIASLLCLGPRCNGDGIFMTVDHGYIGDPQE